MDGMAGIMHMTGDRLLARHPVYVRSLLENEISTVELTECIRCLLEAFTVYDAPIIRYVSRNEGEIFKKVINNRFLRRMLRSDERSVLQLYETLEKPFERDGLFWVQYGLALRHFGHQEEAFDKLRTAVDAHEQMHALHAFAQQKLIVALHENDRRRAERLVDEARETLEQLARVARHADMYPLNVLAKGHTAYVRQSQGDDRARVLAQEYAKRIESKGYKQMDGVTRDLWTWLSSYAVSGKWEAPNLVGDGTDA